MKRRTKTTKTLERIKEEAKKNTSPTKEGKGGADMVKKNANTVTKANKGEINNKPRIITS